MIGFDLVCVPFLSLSHTLYLFELDKKKGSAHMDGQGRGVTGMHNRFSWGVYDWKNNSICLPWYFMYITVYYVIDVLSSLNHLVSRWVLNLYIFCINLLIVSGKGKKKGFYILKIFLSLLDVFCAYVWYEHIYIYISIDPVCIPDEPINMHALNGFNFVTSLFIILYLSMFSSLNYLC